jgi:hypothetical protein
MQLGGNPRPGSQQGMLSTASSRVLNSSASTIRRMASASSSGSTTAMS